MLGPTDLLLAFIVIGLPVLFMIYMARGYFRYKEKELEAETTLAAEKAAQYAASNAQLEQRVRVLEQIATDSGAQTASRIEALRERPALESGEKSE
jgi:hypothetical protein